MPGAKTDHRAPNEHAAAAAAAASAHQACAGSDRGSAHSAPHQHANGRGNGPTTGAGNPNAKGGGNAKGEREGRQQREREKQRRGQGRHRSRSVAGSPIGTTRDPGRRAQRSPGLSPGQSSSARRRRFVSERLRFAAIRRSTARRLGRVGRRLGGGGATAAASISAIRSSAASRLRSWDRCSDAVTVSTPSTRRPARRSNARVRWTGPKALVVATSRLNSTRESAVLTDCPPGPDEWLNLQRNSPSGTTIERLTRRGPTMPAVWRRPRPGRPASISSSGERGSERPTPVDVGAGRLEAFSDAVMAVIITILALELRPPGGPNPRDLYDQLPSLLIYVLSFVFIATYWNNHHHLLRATTRISGAVMWANMLLLFCLSLIPVVTEWLHDFYRYRLPAASFGIVALAAAFSYSGARARHHPRERSRLVGGNGDRLGSQREPVARALCRRRGPGLRERWIAYALYAAVAVMWLIPDRRFMRAADRR